MIADIVGAASRILNKQITVVEVEQDFAPNVSVFDFNRLTSKGDGIAVDLIATGDSKHKQEEIGSQQFRSIELRVHHSAREMEVRMIPIGRNGRLGLCHLHDG